LPILPAGFSVIREIASSYISTVRLVRDADGDEVVLKTPSESDTRTRRFEREITTTRDHAGYHVMPVLRSDANFSWFTMPKAARSLWEVSESDKDWHLALTVAQAVADALRPVHGAGQVHRDLKPQNILWLETREEARWVVSDFGEVRNPAGLTTHQLTRPDSAVGTDQWMAPEQRAYAHDATPVADVYALGAVVAWVLTNTVPSPWHVPLPRGDARIRGVLARATTLRPSDRFPDLDAFVSALEDSATPAALDLASAIDARAFIELNALLLDPQLDMYEVALELPRLPAAEIEPWCEADPSAFARAARATFAALRASDLFGSKTDRLMMQGVDIVRALFRAGKDEEAERVAIDLFAAIAEKDQWDPADEVIRLIGGAVGHRGDLLESAAFASGSRDYFQAFAARRSPRGTDSPALRRLRHR